jgi:hypothetical protein
MHRIYYHPNFDADAVHLGGIPLTQRLITPVIEILEHSPEAFGLLSVDSGVRYAIIRASRDVPELLLTFIIDADGDVMMMSIRER